MSRLFGGLALKLPTDCSPKLMIFNFTTLQLPAQVGASSYYLVGTRSSGFQIKSGSIICDSDGQNKNYL